MAPVPFTIPGLRGLPGFALLAWGLLAASLPTALHAQAAGTVVTRSDWTAPDSRQLFRSLDRSRDDRLDIFEAGQGLAAVQDHRSRQDFHRIDQDRDGYIDWREFDALFRLVIAHREAFQVRPYYPLPQTPVTETASPAQRILASLDRDGDGGAGRDEILGVLQQMGAANLVDLFPKMDTDGSGVLDATEFEPILVLMPSLANLAPAGRRSEVPADHDGDGVVAAAELGRALRLLDPSLGRWAGRILANADRNKDEKLDPRELGLVDEPTAGVAPSAPVRRQPRR